MSAIEILRQAYLVALAEIQAAMPPPPPDSEESDTTTVVAEEAPADTPPRRAGGREILFDSPPSVPRLPLARMNASPLIRQTGEPASLLPPSPPVLRRHAAEILGEADDGLIRRNINWTVHGPIYERVHDDLAADAITYDSVRTALTRAIDNESVPGEMIRPYVTMCRRADGLGQSFRFDLLGETEASLDPNARRIADIDGLFLDVVLDYIACHYILMTCCPDSTVVWAHPHSDANMAAYNAAVERSHDIYDNIVGLLIK